MRHTVSVLSLIWCRLLWRQWKRSPKSMVLLTTTLAVGVGVFFSIRLANRAAVAGFQLFTGNLTGESDLVVTAPSGQLNDSILPELRRVAGELPVLFFPVLESTATDPAAAENSDGFFSRQYQVVGLDLPTLANLVYLADPEYRPPRAIGGEANLEPSETASESGSAAPGVYVTRTRADEMGWEIGDQIELIWNSRLQPLVIAGILPRQNFRAQPPDNLLLLELADAQRLSGLKGKLHRVELRLPPGPLRGEWMQLLRQQLEQHSEGRWTLTTPERMRSTGETMTRAFRLNLTVLSCLALLVGMYLVIQALEASVVRRRMEIGILRSLGVESGHIRLAWMMEALFLGVAGSALGLVIGLGGAQLAVRAIAATVNSLYYNNTVAAAAWNWNEAALAFGIGLATSLVAGWLPARDAAETPPAQVVQRGYRGGGIRWLQRPLLGLAFLLGGMIAWQLPPVPMSGKTWFPLAGYVAAILFVLSGSILVGQLFSLMKRFRPRQARSSAAALFACSQMRRPTGRHRLSAAGLVAAFGMAAGMSILIASFEHTMQSWIDRALKADLYIAPQGVGNVSNQNRIEPEIWRQLADDPAVAEAEVGQMKEVQFEGAATYLVGANSDRTRAWRNMIWLKEPDDMDLLRTASGKPFPAWANESFMNRFEKTPGDILTVPTPQGRKSVRIEGVFADYGNERGSLVVHREWLSDWFNDDRALNLALHLKPDQDLQQVRDRLSSAHPGLVIRINRQLREDVLEIFHQTFAVTYALKWIGLVVAIAGMGLALISLAIERKREFATLQELGMGRRGVASAVSIEGALLALAGTIGGAVLSVILGALLIFVINRQSFGWTLSFQVPWMEIALTGVLLIAVSAAVCWRVGLWAAGLPADREE